MSILSPSLTPVRPVSFLKVVPSQNGGWSLMPMETLLRGLRNTGDMLSLELFGVDGVINYAVRTTRGDNLSGMFNAYFPQAMVSSRLMGDVPGEVGESDIGDWMFLDEDEHALVQPLGLLRDSYLPLRVFDDRVLQQSEMDPLAGVIGTLSGNSQGVDGRGSDRMGLRLVICPAPEDWSASWQKSMQARRDGDDRSPRPGSPGADSGPSMGTVFSVGGLGLVGIMNYLLWNNGNIPGMVLFNAAVAAVGFAGFKLWSKFSGGGRRAYLDEALVEEKLKSLGFWTELQIVGIYRDGDREGTARSGIDQVIECIRSFDDPAGNSWHPGRMMKYDGATILNGGLRDHPFIGGARVLDWVDRKRARRTVLSAREAASIWHLPLGMSEMASMERIASGALVPFLGELTSDKEDSGPLVGMAGNREVRFPESSLRKHAIILGRSGTGKSTFVKHVIDHKLRRKAAGKDDGAIVVIDPHADLVREILQLVPEEIAHKVRLLDFGRMDRVPGINLVDPELFPDRDRCVDTIINTVKHLWEHWGSRLEDLLKNSLLIVYEFNSHPDTRRDEMLTMLDILALLEDGVETGQGRNTKTEMSPFQRRAISRVRDPRLKQWFKMYLRWPPEQRAEAVGPVHSRVGAYASNKRSSVVMGQRESTIVLSDVLSEGLVLLVSTAQGTIGIGPAALMGGTIVSLVDSALRAQENLDPSERSRCLLVCDEFQAVTGADWEGMFAESRKYGCSMMLATQSIVRLDSSDRPLKAGVLGNVGVIVGYQMSADDARVISAEMDSERVPEQLLVNLNPRHCCVRINSDTTCYPAFSLRTLPPPDLSHGSDAAVNAVLRASEVYTVDYAEVRERMDREVEQWLDSGSKLGAGSLSGEESGDGATGSGAGTSSGLYDQANRSGAAGRPNRAARRAEKNRRKDEGASPEAEVLKADAPEADAPDMAAPSPAPVASSNGGSSKGASLAAGVGDDAVQESKLAPEVLDYILREGNRDPGLRRAIDRRMGNQVSRAYRNARTRAESEVAPRVEAEVSERLQAVKEKAREEALVDARRELAESLSEPGEGRSLTKLRRPGVGD